MASESALQGCPVEKTLGKLASAEVPHDSPQCVFCHDRAKVAPIAAFLIAFLRGLETADSMAEIRVCCETISALNREEYRDFAVVKGSAAIIPFGFGGDFALLIKSVTGNYQGRFCRRTL